jgi:serine/threonine protein kinase
MNRYTLEDKIGEGTFGDVFRATKKADNTHADFVSSIMMPSEKEKVSAKSCDDG